MSDEAKQPWTPGEWEASPTDRVLTGPMAEDFADWVILVGRYPGDDEGMVVARAYNDAGQCTKANAHLMAAAPVLAKALAELVEAPGMVWQTPEEKAAKERAYAVLSTIDWKWGG